MNFIPKLLTRIATLLIAVTLAFPAAATAQFVAKGEVASLGNTAQQQDLQRVLDTLAKKNDTARKKVLVVLSQLDSKSIGASNTKRQVEGTVGLLKSEFNKVLADYARQTPPTTSLREAYRVAQTYLNDIRSLTDVAVTTSEIDKKLDPSAPTGKYLEHQKNIQVLVTKALTKADARLADRGKKETVRRDLEQIVADTQRHINSSTASYMLENAELLESALKRVNTKVLEGFSTEMEARFKTANSRSADKENDLNAEEEEIFQIVKKEMSDVIDRSISTIDSLVKQVLTANLPTSSQEPGVNPLLEAKFKTQKQLADILKTSLDRVRKINARANQNNEYSSLLKEVIDREATRQKQRLQDTYAEYEGNFIAGDPTRQQYTKRKNAAQDKAEGCTSFLCDIGRVISGAGSAFISGATGGLVNIPPQTFSSGLFGIQNPTYAASPYSSSYFNGVPSLPNVNGRYLAPGAYGNQSIISDPRCFVLGEPHRQFVLIDSVKAQQIGDHDFIEATSIPSRVIPAPNPTAVVTAVPRSDTRNQSFVDQIRQTIQRGAGFQLGGFGIGTPPFNPNTSLLACPPGTPGYYRAAGGVLSTGLGNVFGGLPVGQSIFGSGTTNDQLRLTLNQANMTSQLSSGFRILAGITKQDGYREVADSFGSGDMTTEKLISITTKLRELSFYKLANNGGDSIINLFLNLCSYTISGDQNMRTFCQGIITVNNITEPQSQSAVLAPIWSSQVAHSLPLSVSPESPQLVETSRALIPSRINVGTIVVGVDTVAGAQAYIVSVLRQGSSNASPDINSVAISKGEKRTATVQPGTYKLYYRDILEPDLRKTTLVANIVIKSGTCQLVMINGNKNEQASSCK